MKLPWVLIGAVTSAVACGNDDEPRASARGVADRPEAPPPPDRKLNRQPRPIATEPARAAELVVVAGGDINLGREVGQRLLGDSAYDPFDGIAALVRMADVAFANLESPISDQSGETRAPDRPLAFTAPPQAADALAFSGFDVLSVANNHIWDYGRTAFFETLERLGEARLSFAGAGRQPHEHDEPTVIRVRGWSLALFAATDVWNPGPFRGHEAEAHVAWADAEWLAPAVRRARHRHDVVLVSYHGGREYSPHPAMEPMQLASRAMEAGADAVIGHHPHVPQGVRWFDGRPVFYSLGNLVFGRHRDHDWTARGFIAKLTFRPSAAPDVELCPVLIENDEPRLLEPHEMETQGRLFARHLSRLAHHAHVGGAAIGSPREHGCLPIGPP